MSALSLLFFLNIIFSPSPETREAALLELSKKREVVSDLAPMLWHSFGTMAALLQVSTSNKYFLVQF